MVQIHVYWKQEYKFHTCIHILVTFGSFWKLMNILNLIESSFYKLVLILSALPKGLWKILTNRNIPGTCILKLLSFTLYWVATCVQSVSSKKYPIYSYTIHLIHHKSSLIGGLMSLFSLGWDCTWLFLLLILSNCLWVAFKVCKSLSECSSSVFLHWC